MAETRTRKHRWLALVLVPFAAGALGAGWLKGTTRVAHACTCVGERWLAFDTTVEVEGAQASWPVQEVTLTANQFIVLGGQSFLALDYAP